MPKLGGVFPCASQIHRCWYRHVLPVPFPNDSTEIHLCMAIIWWALKTRGFAIMKTDQPMVETRLTILIPIVASWYPCFVLVVRRNQLPYSAGNISQTFCGQSVIPKSSAGQQVRNPYPADTLWTSRASYGTHGFATWVQDLEPTKSGSEPANTSGMGITLWKTNIAIENGHL